MKLALCGFALLFLLVEAGSVVAERADRADAAKRMIGAATVLNGKTVQVDGVQIVLWGIETPALAQSCTREGEPYPCGKAARRYLIDLTSGLDVACDIVTAGYLRMVGRCHVGDVDLALLMVAAGHAFDRLGPNGPYRQVQTEARAAGKGVWSGRFQRPELWRRENQ